MEKKSSVEILNYLNSKYNRPSEVCESHLAIIKRLPAACNDKDMIHNILKFLSIHHDLVGYEEAAKIDTYFVNSVRHIILTEPKLKRYLREHESHLRKSRAIKKSNTVGASGDLLGGSGSDSDGDSDDSLCSRFSFADKGAFSGDTSST